jgi:hypothetical protein
MPWAKRALCLGTICAVRKTCTTGGSELAPCLKYARTHVHNWHAARGNCSVLIGCLGSFNYACTLPTGQRQMLVVEVSLLVVSVTRAVPPMLTCELHQITDYLNTVRSVPVTMAAQPACMTRMNLKGFVRRGWYWGDVHIVSVRASELVCKCLFEIAVQEDDVCESVCRLSSDVTRKGRKE